MEESKWNDGKETREMRRIGRKNKERDGRQLNISMSRKMKGKTIDEEIMNAGRWYVETMDERDTKKQRKCNDTV